MVAQTTASRRCFPIQRFLVTATGTDYGIKQYLAFPMDQSSRTRSFIRVERVPDTISHTPISVREHETIAAFKRSRFALQIPH